MTSEYPWRPIGDGQVRVAIIDLTAAVEVKDKDGMAWVLVDDPDQLMQLASRLVNAASALRDKQDVALGTGGDQ